MVAVGIDLGTTNSCVAVYSTNGVEIIANDAGDRTTPSYVLFVDRKAIVGKGAKTTSSKNSKQLVYDAKRMLGKKFTDETLKSDMEKLKWPFTVKSDASQRPRIHIDKFQDKSHQLLPEQISAYVLQKMKKIAEEFHLGPGKILDGAVITVPAYFNDDQKQATKAAAEIAGLKVLRLLSEPSAAGLAFCYQRLKQNLQQEHSILVYDLGGGTFDVSIMKIYNGQVEVKVTAGDTQLGGNDFDAKLMEYCINKIENDTDEDISKNKKALWKLRSACIIAKEHLSNVDNDKYDLEIEALYDGEDFECTITRQNFEGICQDLFEKTMEIVEKALKDAKMAPQNIDEVLLVGGSSRIPKVQEMLIRKFGAGKINKTINADEAVAYGAAIQAAIITGEIEKQCNIVLMDVTPLSLGMRTWNCGCKSSCDCSPISKVIIPRNSKIPTQKSHPFRTKSDNQTSVKITVLEGEHELADKNHKLGEYTITGVPKNSAGKESIDVTFSIDANAILTVTAKIISTGKTADMAINYNKTRLNPDDVSKMLKDLSMS